MIKQSHLFLDDTQQLFIIRLQPRLLRFCLLHFREKTFVFASVRGQQIVCLLQPGLQVADTILEEVMDYRTFCCAIAKPSAKPTAALVLNLKHKKEHKMDLPGRNVDFGASFPPLLQREIPTRFLQ